MIKKWKFFLSVVMFLLCLTGVTVALLPMALSTEQGKNMLISWINSHLVNKVLLKELSLSWSEKQSFKGFELRDAQHRQLAVFDELTIDSSLWQLLMGNEAIKATFKGNRIDIPLLGSVVTPEKTIAISIEKKGFKLPLFPFDLWNIEIAKGSIDFGKVTFEEEGNLAPLFALLKVSSSAHSTVTTTLLKVWFTPLYFSLHKGKWAFERMDLLIANAYPMALWGYVDARKDRVQMMLGLTAKSLAKAFHIDKLDPDDILVLPITGTLQTASIDKKKAIAKISTLVAKKEGGLKGALINGMLQVTGKKQKGEEETIPSPTTHPLPWQ